MRIKLTKIEDESSPTQSGVENMMSEEWMLQNDALGQERGRLRLQSCEPKLQSPNDHVFDDETRRERTEVVMSREIWMNPQAQKTVVLG